MLFCLPEVAFPEIHQRDQDEYDRRIDEEFADDDPATWDEEEE